jgi:CheY-like chemotaxis protein
LEEAGYIVLLARDGREATKLAEGDQIDLAILDINMPIMDGYEAATRIKQRAPALPILFFTAHDADGSDAARNATVARIKKSDDLSELKRAIAALLEEA